ncbi:MAG: GSCFA domain-containing protein [Prolixibacteraceae bacterium]|nr:GSCFA domain-containing protein [Prolixibacteraceae bacterium]MBN2774520.1 GSCFA domain-containing protein [Prolixibacteraceae bacterium]
MRFYTEVDIPDFPVKIDYSSKIMMMGSCFAEEMGAKMEKLKYNIDVNPFGILYNPVSIANSLKILIKKRMFNPGDLYFKDGLWFSFSHHGKFSSEDQEKVLKQVNLRISAGAENLRNADYLFLTFGTAWVYELKSTGQVVTNCHKVPEAEFKRYRLPVNEITEVFSDVLNELWLLNPKLQVVFTISPIRHWKDGAIENQVSKSTLLLAVNNIIESVENNQCSYFPSYEIVMDELRDYRFYAPDMLHLSEVATQYIWNKFEQALITEESGKISNEILKIQKAVEHRPVNRNTPVFKNFVTNSLFKIEELLKQYPNLNLNLEKEYFNELKRSL